MGHHLGSLYAAVLIPRDENGEVAERAFCTILEFLLSKGIAGVVVNGATGEYCLTSPSEIERVLARCRDILGNRAQVLCSLGSASLKGALALGDLAVKYGAAAVLLPMPYFFPYSQDDLRSFSAAAAKDLRAPVLLYNLPAFTTGLEPSTVVDLIASTPNIVGIKDSSGTLDIFRALDGTRAKRFVGDDSILVRALEASVCEGVISGIAGVLPELTRFLVEKRTAAVYARVARLQEELIDRISPFPTPWGLKLIAESRGLAPATFAQSVSERREAQMRDFCEWFPAWWRTTQELIA